MNVNIMQKEYDCPICNSRFKAPRPRMAKLNLIGVDNDLRPYYEGIDTVFYEVVVCSSCGFTAHNQTFENFDPIFVERTKKGMDKIKKDPMYLAEITLDDAIDRYICAINFLEYKKTPNSEYYYLYSRLAWLYRALDNNDALENEFLALKKAYNYLEDAYKNESIPFFGLDESNIIFILGETARRIGEYDRANLYIGKSILDPNSNDELRERAKKTRLLISSDIEQISKLTLDSNTEERMEVPIITKPKLNKRKKR